MVDLRVIAGGRSADREAMAAELGELRDRLLSGEVLATNMVLVFADGDRMECWHFGEGYASAGMCEHAKQVILFGGAP